MYKNQCKTSVIVLIPIILLLFLSLHFKIWSGSYTEGDLESIVVHQMESFERGKAEENTGIDRSSHLLDYVYFISTEIDIVLLFTDCLFICFVYCMTRPSITLCSLSVRMND